MKNKGKVFKALGVGALSLTALVGCTGCTGINFTQEQTDSIAYSVEKSATFMDEIIELLQKQNNEMDKQNAYEIYTLATQKLQINYNNIWSNLRVTVTQDRNHTTDISTMSYGKIDGKDTFMLQCNDGSYLVCQQTTSTSNSFKEYQKGFNGITLEYSLETLSSVDMYNVYGMSLYHDDVFEGFAKDDIKSIEANQDGDYEISIAYLTQHTYNSNAEKTYTSAHIAKFVISTDGILKSGEMSKGIAGYAGLTSSELESLSSTSQYQNIKLTYEYGVEFDATTAQNYIAEVTSHT